MTLINARISKRSYGRYKALKFFFAPIFNLFKTIFTQSNADLKSFLTLGVAKDKLSILGDIKTYNVVRKKESIVSYKQCHHHTTLLVGSLHSGELDIYLKLFCELRESCPELRMIIAPRHFTWIEELESKMKNTKLRYAFWTTQNNLVQEDETLPQMLENKFKDFEIICLCKLGELFNLYQFTDLFYLGGTFVNVGGHNLLEPAVWSKPCIIGPYCQNTKQNADEMEKVGGLIKVKNYEELKIASQKLLLDAELRSKMGTANLNWIKGAAEKVEILLTPLISKI